jgi:hypothetical protein
VEVIVAGVLSSIVLACAAMLLQSQSRMAHNISTRSERNDAGRSALLTLRAELQTVTPATDLRSIARDSIASRIFRGIAVVCGFRSGSTYVRYEGLRLPDPAKDSAVQVGIENVTVLESVSSNDDACPHTINEEVLTFTWQTAAPIGSLWLVFESGAYHLSTNALRYRRGAESRQPITNEIINDRASSFAAVRDTQTRGVRVTLRDRASAAVARDNVLLLNRR